MYTDWNQVTKIFLCTQTGIRWQKHVTYKRESGDQKNWHFVQIHMKSVYKYEDWLIFYIFCHKINFVIYIISERPLGAGPVNVTAVLWSGCHHQLLLSLLWWTGKLVLVVIFFFYLKFFEYVLLLLKQTERMINKKVCSASGWQHYKISYILAETFHNWPGLAFFKILLYISYIECVLKSLSTFYHFFQCCTLTEFHYGGRLWLRLEVVFWRQLSSSFV